MKLTIIVPDGTVGIDGEFRHVDLTSINPNLRAVQWDGTKGHIEFEDGSPNQAISNIVQFTNVVNAWQALTPPAPTPPTIDELKASAWANIKAHRDQLIQTGGYKVGTKWFHSDTFSRTQQIGLTMMGANIPAGLQWKTMDGSFIEMTPTLAQQIFSTAAQNDAAIFTRAEVHRATVYALTDSAAVLAYDITTGWPAVFA